MVVHIEDNTDLSALSDQVSQYHADMIDTDQFEERNPLIKAHTVEYGG